MFYVISRSFITRITSPNRSSEIRVATDALMRQHIPVRYGSFLAISQRIDAPLVLTIPLFAIGPRDALTVSNTCCFHFESMFMNKVFFHENLEGKLPLLTNLSSICDNPYLANMRLMSGIKPLYCIIYFGEKNVKEMNKQIGTVKKNVLIEEYLTTVSKLINA